MCLLLALCASCISGCRSTQNWWSNGLKVGPDYARPAAPVNGDWIEQDPAIVRQPIDNLNYWHAFQDPVLERLIHTAYQNNLQVKTAVFRVVQTRHQLAATRGDFWPQSQTATGSYTRQQNSRNTANAIPGAPRVIDSWATGLNLTWEVDFWGRIRRSISAAGAEYNASIEDLDNVLVTLVADVASTYLELRSIDQRLAYAQKNIEIQAETLRRNETKKELKEISGLDVEQALSNLRQTEASVPQLLQSRRRAQNRLCVLLGMPPAELQSMIGAGDIPIVPEIAVVGIPAELLRRRPDIRSAERSVAAQSERIGIAQADLYPAFAINGTMSLSSADFADLFSSQSTGGSIGPSFRWNILNYGRIKNKVEVQRSVFKQQVANYQNTVLTAQREVEDAMAQFLYARRQYAKLTEATTAMEKAVKIAKETWKSGTDERFTYNQVFTVEANLVSLQDQLVQVELQVAQGFVQIYRALGGGWEIRNEVNCLPRLDCHFGPDEYCPKRLPGFCPIECQTPNGDGFELSTARK